MHRNFALYSFSVVVLCIDLWQTRSAATQTHSCSLFLRFQWKLFVCVCVFVCVTCTRKGNLTHRRQPSRSSSNIKNFLQSLTIECKRRHFRRQQYYVTNSKLYSLLYAVQLVIKSFGWSKLDSRRLCIHVTSNINSIYERRKFYRCTSNYTVTK